MVFRRWFPSLAVATVLVAMVGCAAPAKRSTGLIAPPNAARAPDTERPREPSASAAPVAPSNTEPQTPAATASDAPTGLPTPGPLDPGVVGGVTGGDGVADRVTLNALLGLVTGPAAIIATNGSRIVANNGSRLLSNNGSSLIGNNGGAIVSSNGSRLISDQSGSYRILAATPQSKLTNAFIYLTNRDEKFFRDPNGQIYATTVDSSGSYAFSTFPFDKDVVVNALLNDNLRLVGFGIPDPDGLRIDIGLGTTLAVEYLRGDAFRRNVGLGSYNQLDLTAVTTATTNAVASGDLESVTTIKDQTGTDVAVGRFDLRTDHTNDLRNQYVIAFSQTTVGNAVLKGLSDLWTAILGERPAAITSLIGSGGPQPDVEANDYFRFGFATGDQRGDGPFSALSTIPLGYNYGLAVAKRGDIFMSAYTSKGSSGHIRWIHPDGRTTSLWLPTYGLSTPTSLCIEKEPTDDLSNPGALLVTDTSSMRVIRVPMVDEVIRDVTFYNEPALDPPEFETHRMEVVAGESTPIYTLGTPFGDFVNGDHPFKIQDEADNYAEVDYTKPLKSRWRAADEGPRVYVGTTDPIANPGRYAHLDNPRAVTVDELGNIYIAELDNHRIRMVPSAAGIAASTNYFAHKTPVYGAEDSDEEQEIQSLGATTTMEAGAIYTIAGNPDWNPAKTPVGTSGWFGDYGGDNGPAQLAKLDSPYALAFDNVRKCLYVADIDNMRIRKIDRTTGIITTFAGNPPEGQRNNGQDDFDFAGGYSGDGGPATAAQINAPRGLAVDDKGRVYINDANNGLIRLVETDGTIRTVAGRYHDPAGAKTDNANDGDARHYADLYDTEQIALDPQGNLLLNDFRHGRVRKIWRQWE